MIFVAATDNQDNLASFSDYGSRTVAVGAPGVDMTLPIPGGLYAPLSGTSFAAPMVFSAIAAAAQEPRAVGDDGSDWQGGDSQLGGCGSARLAGKNRSRGVASMRYKALNYLMGQRPPSGSD